jgi:hypothetical protein
MSKIHTILFLLVLVVSCASVKETPNPYVKAEKVESIEDIVNRAAANATIVGKKILEASRTMIANKEIIVGGCWNYINTVFNRAGFPANQRTTVFKSKITGPYLSADNIKAGDWLYFMNHSHGEGEHKEKMVALMVSYVGEKQKKPAFYKQYTLTNIYNVFRPHD